MHPVSRYVLLQQRISGSLDFDMRLPFILFCYFSAFALLGFSGWLDSSFDSPSIDQIIYHFHYSEGAAVKLGRIFVVTFLAECVGFPLAFAVAATFAHGSALRRFRPSPANELLLSSQRGPLRFVVAGRVLYWVLPLAAIGAGAIALLFKLSAFSFVGYHFAEDHFSSHFADPNKVELKAGKLKNLILIYVESMEAAYSDAQVFNRDLLRHLRPSGGVSFNSYLPAPGTTWTIAGMVATQCGVPLRVYSEHNIKRNKEQSKSFLPGATCLGDILSSHGYHNVFLGGAPLSFAGKGAFLKDHGYQTVYGRDEWEKEGVTASEMSEWGLYDSALFARAKEHVKTLHASDQRFNLTLLTLDTHNPRGFMSQLCRDHGARNFEDIVECTSQQLADFVKFLSDNDYLKDTNIVILGDHLAVSNPVFEKLKLVTGRRIFNQFISDRPPAKNTEVVIPFDFFPTLLEFTGIQVMGDRLGLGYSGLFESETKRPEHRLEELTLPSLGGSASYNNLWRSRSQ